MNNDQNRDPNQGQQGLDRETELRNKENEAGQSKDQPFGEKKDEKSGEGFVGQSQDQSSDYLTKGEKDFAPEGQGADGNPGQTDIETGQSRQRDAELDDGSQTDR